MIYSTRVACLLCLSAALNVGCGGKPEQKQTPPKNTAQKLKALANPEAARKPVKDESPLKTSMEKLQAAFAEDWEEASKQYTDRILHVTGSRVSRPPYADLLTNSNVVDVGQTGQGDETTLHAFISPSDYATYRSLSVTQKVTIEGTYRANLGQKYLVLQDAKIISTSDDPALEIAADQLAGHSMQELVALVGRPLNVQARIKDTQHVNGKLIVQLFTPDTLPEPLELLVTMLPESFNRVGFESTLARDLHDQLIFAPDTNLIFKCFLDGALHTRTEDGRLQLMLTNGYLQNWPLEIEERLKQAPRKAPNGKLRTFKKLPSKPPTESKD